MAAFGPFEPAPRIAVGVSGGADSTALLRLTADWASARGGSAVALTVDHGLRSGAAEEARRVGARCHALGIGHEVLVWDGSRAEGNLQAAARDARYRLLDAACRRLGILHLAVAHHRGDQAETVLQRLARGSGARGLAAMAPVRFLPSVRLIRPFLSVPRCRLEATLRSLGETWSDDPTNQDPAFARVSLRRALASLAGADDLDRRLAETASRLAGDRRVLDRALVGLLADAVVVSPWGHAEIDGARVAAAEPALGLAALARTIMVVGGAEHPPRAAALERLAESLVAADGLRPRTLGGCRIVAAGRNALVCREAAAAEPPVALTGAAPAIWDRRFRIGIDPRASLRPVAVGPLGPGGWRLLAREAGAEAVSRAARAVPPPARPALPALRDAEGLLGVPGLDLWHERAQDFRTAVSVRFAPRHPLAPPTVGAVPQRHDPTRNFRL